MSPPLPRRGMISTALACLAVSRKPAISGSTEKSSTVDRASFTTSWSSAATVGVLNTSSSTITTVDSLFMTSSSVTESTGHGKQRAHLSHVVCFRGAFVRPIPPDPREAQREAAGITGARLHVVERHLHNQLGANVHRPCVTRHLQREQALGLPAEHLVRHALEGLAEHDPPARSGVARAEMKVAEPAPAPAVAPFGGEHDEIEGVRGLHLEPRLSSPPRLVGSVERLRHHSLVSRRERALQKPTGVVAVRRAQPWDAERAGHHPAQRFPTFRGGDGQEARAVEPKQIERESGERQLGPERVDLEPAAEAAHRRLKRQRTAVGAQRDRFAVEDKLPSGERTRRFDDLGYGGGDVVAQASEDGDVAARLVDLYSGAVDLPLERGFAELVQRGVEVRRRLREHRLQRAKELYRESRDAGRAPFGRGARHLAEVPPHHHGAAYVSDRHRKRGGHRVRDEPFERPLTQLAHGDAEQEILLLAGGEREQRAESFAASRLGARASNRGDLVEDAVDPENLQIAGAGRVRGGARERDRPEADFPLA